MVTIEQKLLLFSKLLNQSMDKKFQEELKEMEKQYKEKLQKNKENVDSEVRIIEERARIGTETKRTQSLSKSKVKLKKEIMSLNEKYYNIFMDKFKNKLYTFVQSDRYKEYLSNIILRLNEEFSINSQFNNIIVYLSKNDYDKYAEYIKQLILKDKSEINIIYNTTDLIIGGLIIENSDNNYRIDLSVDSILEDNKTYIMQTLFEALEAGVYNG